MNPASIRPTLQNKFAGAQVRRPATGITARRTARRSAMAFKGVPETLKDHPALKNFNPRLYINGEYTDGSSGETFEVVDPRTEEVMANCALANADDVDRAAKAAREAFDHGEWTQMGGAARGRLIYKLADLIEQNAEELASMEALDNGKPYQVALNGDIPAAVAHFRYYAGWADKIHGKTIPVPPMGPQGKFQAFTLHEPIGVAGLITPFNFPLLMLTWCSAPALAAGCTVVAKVAEQTPLSGLRLAQLATEAGFPKGVFNVITGPGESGAALTAHKMVDKISFTGSTDVGKIIIKACADSVKKVTMELGGKNPLIIWKDVDLNQAVEDAHMALFYNMGQCCAAGSRIYVHSDIYDDFVKLSAEKAKSRVVGDPFDDKTQQGPQVDKDQFEKILHYINLGKEQGARLCTGGKRHGQKGYYVEPTVFADVGDDMAISKEEIFGPVQVIMKFDNLKDVMQRANENAWGLAAGVFAKDINVVNTLSRGLKAGTIWVNTWNVYADSVPFGGYKQSGLGRNKGEYALDNYTQVKAVYQKLEDPVWL